MTNKQIYSCISNYIPLFKIRDYLKYLSNVYEMATVEGAEISGALPYCIFFNTFSADG